MIRRFAPYYNGSNSAGVAPNETRVLVSTDVLSEGLNLQDATRLINYDLHWNPVRLMQRIGRVDRRMNPVVEAAILKDHPDQAPLRGHVAYWNFLPPADLDRLLKLYSRVAGKTLRISKLFGIEGRKLLTHTDDYEDLKDFNASYEGVASPEEALRLELADILNSDPDLEKRLEGFPNRIFSGRAANHAAGVFFCWSLPVRKRLVRVRTATPRNGRPAPATSAGTSATPPPERSPNHPPIVADFVRSNAETPRRLSPPGPSSPKRERRSRSISATDTSSRCKLPVGVKPILKAWMEVN